MEEVVNEPVVTEPTIAEPVVTPQPGEKTDSALLLKSLQETRAKLKEKDDLIAQLQAPQGEVVSDEGRVILTRVETLERELNLNKNQAILTTLQSKYPALKDKSSEFDDYLLNNPGVSMDMAAKAFLVDNDLFTSQPRKGLEKSTGGTRAPQKVGLSIEEIDDLRVNNYRKYSDMVRKGEIKFD